MTLIELSGRSPEPPCKSCHGRTSCSEQTMRVCVAYRVHLRWMRRHACFRPEKST